MNKYIEVRCRIASINNEGCYIACSSDEAYQLLGGCYDSYKSSTKVTKPYNEVCFSYEFGNHSVTDLHNTILKALGLDIIIPEVIDEDVLRGWPELILEVGPDLVVEFYDENIKIASIIERFQLEKIESFLFITLGRGEIFREDGFRFYIPSHEGNKHNRPHVHVETSSHKVGSIDIATLEQNKGSRLKKHEMTKIKKILTGKQEKLIEAWNLQSDGIYVDVDILLGQAAIMQ